MAETPTRSFSPHGEPTADQPIDGATRDLNDPTAAPGERAAGVSPTPALEGYELLEEVGSGGMGVVYRAREIALDRDVAVKLLQDRFPANSPGARRFLDEARITGQLQHPAIPPVHHIGTLPDGRPFLVMKLIKGETLADLLGGKSPVAHSPGSPNFIPVFAKVCEAVAYAHSRKVIHRDLKPANVMVGAFGEVQVMDWGVAKVLASGGSEPPVPSTEEDLRTEIRTLRDSDSATQAGSVLGTPSFMSPEQAQGAVQEIDERSDVFGLGAVLCAILTGQPPYWGADSDSIRLKAIRGETADALARLDGSGADPELVALAKHCLATDRNLRPRDAAEVAKAVADHLIAAEERCRRAELDRVRSEERQQRRRVQRTLAAAVLGLAAVAGFGVAVASLWQRAERAKETAETARGDAETARGDAVKARFDAETARQVAELARDGEKTARGIAERARDGEKQARKKLERVEYGRTMQVAYQEWRDNNLVAARALLRSTREDLRGWEWHYVLRLCHADLLTLEGHTNGVNSASFSPDGSRIVTGSVDKTAKVWDAKSGAELLTLKGHTSGVISASFSADGSRIVTGSYDKTAKVWDAKSGAELLTLQGHTGGVYSASFSADGSRIVTGSYDTDGEGVGREDRGRTPHPQGTHLASSFRRRSVRTGRGS